MRIDRQNGFTTTRASLIIFGVCIMLLGAVSASAQQVNVDFDRSADFTRYKTFAWMRGTPSGNPLAHQRIIAGIEAQLAAKGLRKVDSNPDLVVAYHTATDEKVSINTWGGGPLGGWRLGPGRASVDKVPVGELVVDIGDVSAKRFVWRGTASGTMSSKPEKNEKTLNSALARMFKDFPYPAGKKK